MDHGLSKVSSKYGAPMGRRSTRGDADTAYNVVIRKVDLDSGGYDIGGAYWGTPSNLWRYFADPIWDEETQTEAEGFEEFVRAADYDAVKAIVMEAYPNAQIIPDSIDDEYRETFTESYIDAAIEDGQDRGEEESDLRLDGLSSCDLADEARTKMEADCKAFIDANAETLARVMCDLSAGDAGYNFYMSRMGHGVGFWDRDLGEDGDKLHEACKHREIYLYRGEDGKIYHG